MAILKLGSTQIGGVGFVPAHGSTSPVTVPWSRPAEWMVLPAAPVQGVSALYGVENSDGNYVALQCTTSAGNYSVDWGDGTTDIVAGTNPSVTFQDAGDTVTLVSHGLPTGSPVTFSTVTTTTGIVINTIYYVINPTTSTFQLAATAGGAVLPLTINGSGVILSVAQHLYDYSAITTVANKSSTVLTVDGMKQCVVTAVPLTGNLTAVNFCVKHVRPGLVTGLSVNWLDVNVAGAYLASVAGSVPVRFGSTTQLVYPSYLERINIGATGVFTNMNYMFQGCRVLRSIVAFPDVSTVTSMSSMLQNCYSLQTIPAFPGSVAAVTSMSSMLQGCYSLQTIPAFPGSVAAVTSMLNMFQNCSSLQTIPAFPGSVAAVTSMSSMFQNCSSLQTIPAFPGSVAAVTSMSYMFNGCSSLQTIPAFPGSVAAVTSMSNMFNGCSSLQTIPAFPGSVAAVTSMSSMFQNCYSLQTIPAFPGSVAAVTSMSYMFLGCYSLQTIPAFPGSVAAVTSMSSMLQGCYSLQTIPAFPGSVAAVTSMSSLLQGCSSLQTIPAFPGSVAAVTSMSTMFYGCSSLQTIPIMDLGYNIAKDRAPTLTVNNWTLGTGWQYLTSPNRLNKNADGTTATTANPPTITGVTGVASTGVITAVNSGFQNNDRVQFSAIAGGTGITLSSIYKVANVSGSTFTLVDLLDAAVTFSTDITSATIARYNMGIVAATIYKVVIVVDAISGGTASYTLGGTAGASTFSTSATPVTYTDYVTAGSTAKLIITPSATSVRMTISSIIIEEQMVTTQAFLADCSLAYSNVTGLRKSASYLGCKLSRAAIINIFNNLGTSEPAGQVIDVSSNHGTADLTAGDRLIASGKGWTVTG